MVRRQLIASDLHILHVHYAFSEIIHKFVLYADFVGFQPWLLGLVVIFAMAAPHRVLSLVTCGSGGDGVGFGPLLSVGTSTLSSLAWACNEWFQLLLVFPLSFLSVRGLLGRGCPLLQSLELEIISLDLALFHGRVRDDRSKRRFLPVNLILRRKLVLI